MSINILIAEDRKQFHHQLKDLIQTRRRQGGLPETASGRQEPAKLAEQQRSDIFLQDGEDMQMLQELHEKYPGMVITVLAFPESEAHQLQVIELGVGDDGGQILHTEQLLGAVEEILCSKAIRPNDETGSVQTDVAARADKEIYGGIEPLTSREEEVLKLIAVGKSNAAVARELAISCNTVKTHLRNIYRKLHLKNRTEAANYALTHGYIA